VPRSGGVSRRVSSNLRTLLNVVLPLLVVALIAENIVLLRQNHRLKTSCLTFRIGRHREEPLHDIGGAASMVGSSVECHLAAEPCSSSLRAAMFRVRLEPITGRVLDAQAKKLDGAPCDKPRQSRRDPHFSARQAASHWRKHS